MSHASFKFKFELSMVVMPAIPALGRLRQEDVEFESSPSNTHK
jgi:hypothetical protein